MIFKDLYHRGQKILYSNDITRLKNSKKEILLSSSKKTGLSLFHFYIINSSKINMNYYHVIEEFINAGVDINSKSINFHHNYNALFLAIETAKNFELVKALIELGADVHAKDLTGNNALFIACRNFKENSDSIKIVELLLSENVSIVSKNNSRVSVKSYVNMIGEAIDQGHNPNSFDLRPLINEDFE